MDIQVVFPDDMQVILIDQCIIGNDGSGNGILYRHDPLIGFSFQQLVNQAMKGEAFYQFDVLPKIFPCYLMMVRTSYSLYGDSLYHAALFIKKKVPLFTGLVFLCFHNYLQQPRASLIKEVKIKAIPESCATHFLSILRLR
jgi:hypothetical protein